VNSIFTFWVKTLHYATNLTKEVRERPLPHFLAMPVEHLRLLSQRSTAESRIKDKHKYYKMLVITLK